jgi:hypothetical protein
VRRSSRRLIIDIANYKEHLACRSLFGLVLTPMPAVKWCQQKLDKLSKERRGELVEGLEKVLFD